MIYCGLQEGRHTGALTGAKIDEVIRSLDLPPRDQCWKTMTTDNASNMKSACKIAEEVDDSFGCFDHTLVLVLKAGVESVPFLDNTIDAFRRLSTACHESDLHLQRIKRACTHLNDSGTNPCEYRKIIQPADTRWNSVLMMLNSIIELKHALLEIKSSERAASWFERICSVEKKLVPTHCR